MWGAGTCCSSTGEASNGTASRQAGVGRGIAAFYGAEQEEHAWLFRLHRSWPKEVIHSCIHRDMRRADGGQTWLCPTCVDTKGHKMQSRPARGFLAVRLFYNCSQIMLALGAILGTLLVMNHILYLISFSFPSCPGFNSAINKHCTPGFGLGVASSQNNGELLAKGSLIHQSRYREEPRRDSGRLLGSPQSSCVTGPRACWCLERPRAGCPGT